MVVDNFAVISAKEGIQLLSVQVHTTKAGKQY
jgi:hypothetical protein